MQFPVKFKYEVTRPHTFSPKYLPKKNEHLTFTQNYTWLSVVILFKLPSTVDNSSVPQLVNGKTNRKKGITGTWNNIGESHNYYAKWKMPNLKGSQCVILFIWHSTKINYSDGKQTKWLPGTRSSSRKLVTGCCILILVILWFCAFVKIWKCSKF